MKYDYDGIEKIYYRVVDEDAIKIYNKEEKT